MGTHVNERTEKLEKVVRIGGVIFLIAFIPLLVIGSFLFSTVTDMTPQGQTFLLLAGIIVVGVGNLIATIIAAHRLRRIR